MHYKKIKAVNRDEHILIMEEYLGRPLEKGEIVHHLDENKQNNSIENIELCLLSVHSRYHKLKGDLFDVAKWSKENLSKPNNHGTRNTYERYGCRCNLCKEAKRKHNAKRYE